MSSPNYRYKEYEYTCLLQNYRYNEYLKQVEENEKKQEKMEMKPTLLYISCQTTSSLYQYVKRKTNKLGTCKRYHVSLFS